MEIAGKVAIVTGAAAGTGRVLAERLGAEGAAIVVADVEHMVAFALERLGGLAILVNNAGGGGDIEPHYPEASPAQWGAWLELNLRGAMLATQLALEPMRASGGGAVINIASSAGLGFEPYVSPEYGAAKAGLIRFTSSLATLRERMGVRVNCVVPDWIATERAQEQLARMSPEERAAAPRQVEPGEVADAVVRLARDEALAGRVIVIWGGEAARLLDTDDPGWGRLRRRPPT
jgi:NAD(P)-dependent dehydrogenase (short-subunit alcohol dehydrogenase family)